MGSRRTMSRSTSWNGRSTNGDNNNGSNRPGGYSYLSNVRPENRSTLCSVMAQLTEETQPSFETTLKSKAVSENCNVKFTCVVKGYPTPQVIWYKDDKQLDRFCGLPKYEIFRNGPNHSLHIYNCTVEDAAIYQASAINGKGIVSCSGVLEVGEMNEFNIHQRYFSKLKQKAEHKRREAEGKENQEPLRTISPDRTQRKRRSTMEAFLSTPSSMEDEGNEESHHAVAVEAEARLQEPKVEEVEEKPVSVTNRAVSTISNGQAVNENANKGGTYIYDTAQKVFTAHQPKTPFVKKKIKISNSTKVAKADVSGERSKDETSTDSGFLVSVESVESKKKSEEVMKVEKIVSSSVVNSDSRKVKEQHQKPETQEAHHVERSSNDKNICVVPSQREQLTAPVSPTHLTSAGHNESGTDGKHENEAGLKDTAEIMEIQTQSPYNLNLTITSTQLESSVPSTLPNMLKKDTIKTQDVTAMDVDEKSDVSTLRDLRSVDVACESRTALPQRPCELTGDQRSEKETSSCQKTVSETGPALLREVTQAHTKINRNDAPVTLELSDNQCMMDAQPPQKTPSERETATRDVQTQSLHHGHQAAIDKMIQDTWGHSSKSYERHTDLFKDQKSALERPGGAENSQECKVSSTAPQSQVQPAIKTPQGTETQADKEVGDFTVDTLSVDIDGVTSNDKILKMETETAVLQLSVQIKTETRDAADKDTDVVAVETLCKEKIEPVLKMSEKSSSEMQKLKKESASDQTGTDVRHLSTSENNLEEIIRINEVSKPASKVISVAELLRSQIKVLDITLANSVPVIPIQDFLQEPKTTTETCQEFRNDGGKCREEVKGLIPDLKTETNTNNTPPHSSIKSTLMELYNQLNKADQDLTQPALPVHALQKPPVTETKGLCDVNVKKYSGGVMDVGQETGAPGLVPLINCPTSPTESENVKALPSSSSNDEPTTRPTFISLTSGLVRQTSGSPLTARTHDTKMTTLENEPVQVKDIDLIQTLTSEVKLNSKTETRTTGSLQTPSSPDTQGNNLHLSQQGGSTAVDSSPTLEVSPRLKERNCVSPIPSATPQELASGARRKILLPKAKQEVTEATSPADNQAPKKDVAMQSSKLPTSPMTPSVSPSLSRRSPLLQPTGDLTPTGENRSPLLSRRQTTFETQVSNQQQTDVTKPEDKPKEKDPFKAPQVIRKIRAETYADTSGHLKVWCQFFNVLSDSTIKWFKNEEEISQIKRTAGDETQVNLAIVQASSCDSGVYGCSITNEYGSDSTDTLLSSDILAGMSLSEDLGVGEEIELTPMIFSRGVADSGIWGNKLFGRIMMQESHIGEGWSHKVWRAKVIYGLEPVFDSGNTCIIKVRNPIAYGGKGESCLIERNLEIIKQNCKIQNLAREYCKIFSTEARVIESFGPSLEVVPVYLMYRPANTVPYATVEADLTGVYQKYSNLDHTGRLDVKTGSGVEQKCCALQHWIFQWTNGNLLLTRLEGVDTKITNVGISVKSTGYQGLSLEGNPKVFEQFVSQHQCNYYCGLLGLRSLKIMDSLLVPTKPKGSKSPLLQRKMAAGSSSPQTGRKAAGSPRLPRKTEQDGRNTPTKQKPADAQKVVKMA